MTFDAEVTRLVAEGRERAAMHAEIEAALPLVAQAQQVEFVTDQTPVLIVPRQSVLAKADKLYGFEVVGVDLPPGVTPMVGVKVPQYERLNGEVPVGP